VVKLNDQFSLARDSTDLAADISGVLHSLYMALSAEELAQVSVTVEDAKLQLSAPPGIVLKIGQALGMPTH
jgi:hypothetical protein